jgi:AcrR family transcriptional regulator
MARTKDNLKIDAIYEATLKLVLKTGFTGLKMEAVAKLAKLATGTVYIYFKNKEVLINQLYLHLKKAKTDKLLEVYDPKDPFEISFKKLWFHYLEISLAEPERMIFIELFTHTSYLTPKTKKQGDQLLEPLISFIKQGTKEGIIRNHPPEIILSQLLGPVYEMVKLENEGTVKLTKGMKLGLFEMAWSGIIKK